MNRKELKVLLNDKFKVSVTNLAPRGRRKVNPDRFMYVRDTRLSLLNFYV